MRYIYTFAGMLLITLVIAGYWKYTLFSLLLFIAVGCPFYIKSRKFPEGKRLKTVFGALLVLFVFAITVFAAAIALNWLFWRLFHV